MKLIVNIILLLISFACHAQDTSYFYDAQWHRTRKKKEYAYKRAVKDSGNHTYYVTDYYYGVGKFSTGKYITNHPEYLVDYRGTLYREDTFKYYYPDGSLKKTGQFVHGKCMGEWIEYKETTGEIASQTIFTEHYQIITRLDSNGVKRTDTIEIVPNGQVKLTKFSPIISTIISMTAKMPEPDYDVYKWLERMVTYPSSAKEKGISGMPRIRFTVDTSGYITDVESLDRTVNEELQLEALRVVGKMPPWKPGEQDGKPIKVFYTLPIKFNL